MHQVQRSPFVDWVIILALSALVAIILVGVGVSVYLGTGDTLSAPTSSAPKGTALPLSETALQNVLTDFDNRSAERASIVRGYNAPRDPSLP